MSTSIQPPDLPVKYIEALTAEQAEKLATYLPVALRDFWLNIDPVMQAYLLKQTRDQYSFFTMIQMECARFKGWDTRRDERSYEWQRQTGTIGTIAIAMNSPDDIAKLTIEGRLK